MTSLFAQPAMEISLPKTSSAEAISRPAEIHTCAPGECLHEAGDCGLAWRVVSGAIRLDSIEDEVQPSSFAGLAIPGDIVGAESLLLGRCTFRATALTLTVLAPWPGEVQPQPWQVLQVLAQTEQRAAKTIALRAGQAVDRVRRLVNLMVQPGSGNLLAVLPSLRDMADITALTFETVSRSLSELQRRGLLEPEGQRRGRGKKTSRCHVLAG